MRHAVFKVLRFSLIAGCFFLLLQGSAMLFDIAAKGDAGAGIAEIPEAGSMAPREGIWSEIGGGESPVLTLQVDYDTPGRPAWFPKGESPLLARMVEAGELPAVEERVGPEPVVLRGVDGIGRYGGTWLRITPTEGGGHDMINSRLSYSSLLRFSPEGMPIVPHVAKAYHVSEDNRIFTFYLREGMKWSDGHPFTAHDVVYCFNDEVLDDAVYGTPSPWMLAQGMPPKVSAPDDYTLRFEFENPYGLFLYQLATQRGAWICNSPRHYLRPFHPRLGDQDRIQREMREQGVSSALELYRNFKQIDNVEHPRLWPWIYRNYRPNGPYSYVRNPYYFAVDEKGNQLPYIDQVLFEVKNADMVTISAAAGGSSMQARHIRFNQYTFLMNQREQGAYQVFHWYNGDRSDYLIHVNINRKVVGDRPAEKHKAELFRDVRFRRALSLAINRQRIIDAEYHGITETAQLSPGRESPFHHESLHKSYTEYAPRKSDNLLDEAGLTDRDLEGYRCFSDGTPLTIYLSYTSFTGAGPALFLIEDWADVGLRVILRPRSRSLFVSETAGMRHDLVIWTGNGEYFPIISPRNFAPTTNASYFAPAFARWYVRMGMYTDEHLQGNTIAYPPPDRHPLMESLATYEEASRFRDMDVIKPLFDKVLDIAAQNVWTINIGTPPPVLAVVSNDMRNVPRNLVYTWAFQSPGNAAPETFYLENDRNSSGTQQQLRENLLRPTFRNEAIAGTELVRNQAQGFSARMLARLIRYLFLGITICFLMLAAWRYPYVARRLLIMIPTLLVISIIVFSIIQLPPGDYISSEVMRLQESGDEYSIHRLQTLKELFRLEDPMYKRYLHWMGFYWFAGFDDSDKGVLQGDLGLSMETMRPVSEVVGDRILLTFLISLGTVLFTWAVAIPMGIYSAVRQYALSDYIITFFGFIGMCIPGFLLALLLMYAASEWFGFTVTGLFSPTFATQAEWDWAKFVDLLRHIWVPVAVMGISGTASMIRVMRANLLDELRKPYVVTARAKGMRPIGLLLKYPVRLALNPFVSGIGGLFPQLVSGGAIVAMVLSLPTVGPLMLSALFSEDMYLAGSMLMVLSLLGVLGTLVSDLLLMWLDPRIRMGG